MLADIFNQSKQPYYGKYFSLAEKKGPHLSWNWGAFVFSCFWLVRRKLYMYSSLFICAGFLGAELLSRLGLPNYWGSIWISILMLVILPMTANAIYYLQTFYRWHKDPIHIDHWTQPHGIMATAILTIFMFMGVTIILGQLFRLFSGIYK